VEFLEIIGERIRSRIKASGVKSVERFAHENGIPKSTLSELLNGKNNPRLTTLARICAGLEVSMADLLDTEAINSWVRESSPHYGYKSLDSGSSRPRKPARKN